MPKFTESATVYTAGVDSGTDKNPLPKQLAVILESVPINVHRGSRQATDEALAIGIDPNLAAMAYCPVSYAGQIKSRYVVQVADEAWVVMAVPNVRNRFPATAHVRMLLQLLNTRPDGLR